MNSSFFISDPLDHRFRRKKSWSLPACYFFKFFIMTKHQVGILLSSCIAVPLTLLRWWWRNTLICFPLCWSRQTSLFVIWNRGKDCIWVRGVLHHFVIGCAHKTTPCLLCLKFSFSWTKKKDHCLVILHFIFASSASSDAIIFLLFIELLSPTWHMNIHCIFTTVVLLLSTIT